MSEVDHGALFTAHRPTMMSAAFHITGSRHDAEDVVQDAWERWARVDLAEVTNPRGFLSVMASRLALNAVRSQRRRRETYLGPWVPDPVVDDGSPEWEVLQREGLGQALDFALSTLTPEQATAYVLRKVLDVDYSAIGDVLDRTSEAARKLVSRAQQEVTRAIGEAAPDQSARDSEALTALTQAVATGEVGQVVALLSPEAVLYSDGGGRAKAALHPITGPEKVARFLLGIASTPNTRLEPARINGAAGIVAYENDVLTTTATLRTGPAGITSLYFIRNPAKLPLPA